ncbi:MAG: hypothetical protein HOE90_11110 [Bacteriovoracaceae bacterium]|jgi:hypothetical protein|nr:hypothetical protein [Bacteriovoracaceae bacterium]
MAQNINEQNSQRDFRKKLFVLSEHESASLPLEQQWFLKVGEKIFGPYSEINMQTYLDFHKKYPKETMVANSRENVWLSPFEVPSFNRRKPQMKIAKNIEDGGEEKIYSLWVDGHRKGPFSESEINELIDKKEILYTDTLSVDNGQSWIKVHENPAFDRRADELPPKELPFTPDVPDLGNTDPAYNLEYIPGLGTSKAIVELAMMGRQDRNEIFSKAQKVTEKKSKFKFPSGINILKSKFFKILSALCLLGALAYGGYALYALMPKKAETAPKKIKAPPKRAARKRPVIKKAAPKRPTAPKVRAKVIPPPPPPKPPSLNQAPRDPDPFENQYKEPEYKEEYPNGGEENLPPEVDNPEAAPLGEDEFQGLLEEVGEELPAEGLSQEEIMQHMQEYGGDEAELLPEEVEY